eukprot:TRINITY_DN977_c0_g4_i1.p1 TRINITY_DN977_c0_g4~~TRINITY_DN977_c0_g4_i1.p1  ORF type:complete len:369 (+),score=59.56 TRINITY_DN977_c0_g4_i1:48-1154(+)
MDRRVPPAALLDLTKSILEGMGCPRDEARIVGEHLVESNLQGHDSHGVQMIMLYRGGIKSGRLRGGVQMKVNEEGPVVRVDAGEGKVHSFGHRTLREAVDICIEKTKKDSVSVLSFHNAGHIGRLGSYGQQVVDQGLVGFFMAAVADHDPLVSLHGGSSAVVCTNPICIALPKRTGEPGDFILDFATSKVALGKVKNMIAKGMTEIPQGLLLDHEGKPSTHPYDVINPPKGALLPFGDHKGSGLALAVELIAGGLTGGKTLHPKNPRHCTPEDQSPVNNVFGIVIDPSKLGGSLDEVAAFMDFARRTRRVDPSTPILLPGEPERLTKKHRTSNGVPIPAPVWSGLLDAAREFGVPKEVLSNIVDKAKL